MSHFFGGAEWEGHLELGDTAQDIHERLGGDSLSPTDDLDTMRDTAYAYVGADFSDLLDRWREAEVREIITLFANDRIRLSDILGPEPPTTIDTYRNDTRLRMEELTGHAP